MPVLQDHRRAVIGTAPLAGSVQTVQPLTEEKAIKLTTARYYPKGRSIQAQGIVPDITIERVRVTAVKNRRSITEAELSGHLNNQDGTEIDSKTRNAEHTAGHQGLQNEDNQLFEALNLLKGIHILSTSQSEANAEPQEPAS